MMATSKRFDAEFLLSVYSLDQLPKDNRPQIAIAGRSNVGKSSLLNRMLGRKKMAKVSSTPGKTRALNFFLVNDSFYFVDLPGYGYAKVSKSERNRWGKLIEEYLRDEKRLIGLLLLLDCRRETTPEDYQLIDWLNNRQVPVLISLTKADKLSKNRLSAKVKQVEEELGCDVIVSSASSGMGKNELVDAVRSVVE